MTLQPLNPGEVKRTFSRRGLLCTSSALAALTRLPRAVLAARTGETNVLFLDWILKLHLHIEQVNAAYATDFGFRESVTSGDEDYNARLELEAADHKSTW